MVSLMIRRRGYRQFLPFLVLALLACGCEKRHETAGPPSSTNQSTTLPPSGNKGVDTTNRPSTAFTATILPVAPTAGDELRAVISGANEPVTYRWQVNGDDLPEYASDRLAVGSFHRGDRVTLIASSGSIEAQAEAEIGNTPPQVISVGYFPPMVRRGTELVAKPQVEDLDGDPVTLHFQWFLNGVEQVGSDSATLPGTVFARGDQVAVEVVPSDDQSEGEAYRTGTIQVENAPPHFVTSPPTTFRSATYIYRAAAEDADGDPLIFTLESGPNGMAIDPQSGEVRWAIARDQSGPQDVRLTVRDPNGGEDVQEFHLDISVTK